MLLNEKGITEKVWQSKVQEIVLLLYPKYILCTHEVIFKGVDGYDKRPYVSSQVKCTIFRQEMYSFSEHQIR